MSTDKQTVINEAAEAIIRTFEHGDVPFDEAMQAIQLIGKSNIALYFYELELTSARVLKEPVKTY